MVDPDRGERIDDRASSKQVLDGEAQAPVGARGARGDDRDDTAAPQLGLAPQGEGGDIGRFLQLRRHQLDATRTATEERQLLVDRVSCVRAAELVDPDDDVRAIRDGRGTGCAPVESDLIAALVMRVAHATRLATREDEEQEAAHRRHHVARKQGSSTMHVQLKLVLDCPPDAAWNAIRSPAVFSDVSFPLVEFEPRDGGEFPEFWEEGPHPVRARAMFGLIDAGSQDINLVFRERHGLRIFEDRGGPLTGPLTIITRWRHRMVIASWPDGRTLFRDRLEFSAGIMTPVVWIAMWAFWQWRSHGLVRLAPGFARRFGGNS